MANFNLGQYVANKREKKTKPLLIKWPNFIP